MDDRWWGDLTKYGLLEKGMGNHFNILENPMYSMQRQKDMTLKDECPRSVGAHYATGEQQRNSSRKNEETKPKWKQRPVVDVSGGESKV